MSLFVFAQSWTKASLFQLFKFIYGTFMRQRLKYQQIQTTPLSRGEISNVICPHKVRNSLCCLSPLEKRNRRKNNSRKKKKVLAVWVTFFILTAPPKNRHIYKRAPIVVYSFPPPSIVYTPPPHPWSPVPSSALVYLVSLYAH